MEYTETPAEQLHEEELEAERSQLRSRSVRGVAITMSTQLLRFFCGLGTRCSSPGCCCRKISGLWPWLARDQFYLAVH
jgi:hypothetical protein